MRAPWWYATVSVDWRQFMSTRARRVALWFAITLLVVPGCGPDRLTYDNYSRVKDGMTAAEVREILGKPDEDKGGGFSAGGIDISGRVMVWEEGEKWVEVTIAQGKVVAKVQKGLE